MDASSSSNKRARSLALFEKAKTLMPGGVNSPVRAFKSVGGNPPFMVSAKGAWMTDEDGNRYLDLINSWGPMLLGHANEKIEAAAIEALRSSPSFGTPGAREVTMAELVIDMVPSIEKVRMVNSGTEATLSAIRLARGATGRDKIIKFAGCYHGHGDSFLIAAGSGALTFGIPDSKGVTKHIAEDTLTAEYNDLDSVRKLAEANKNQIAAIIVEPVPGNMGVLVPAPGFLQGLRELCDAEGILLIFDEVMTGFRLAKGGAQEIYGVRPDLTTLGKIIGGGLPVGAYGGRKELMDLIAPSGPVYQAGTLSGNPVAMAAGIAMLKQISSDGSLYQRLETKSAALANGLSGICNRKGIPATVNRVGSMFTLFFTGGPVDSFAAAKRSDTGRFAAFFNGMLDRGVYLAPSQFEALFVCDAVGEAEIAHFLEAAEASL